MKKINNQQKSKKFINFVGLVTTKHYLSMFFNKMKKKELFYTFVEADYRKKYKHNNNIYINKVFKNCV